MKYRSTFPYKISSDKKRKEISYTSLLAPDPVNFEVGDVLADHVDNLGLGQDDAPQAVVLDIE